MNILHLNQSDIGGGAAIAGYRLHKGLLEKNINSKLLVGHAQIQDPKIAQVKRKYRLENGIYRLTSKIGLNYINLISSFDIAKHPFVQEADILNFHNLHTGYFNYLSIAKLTRSKPAVYTLHDMWSFTGHCAYSYDCSKWMSGCGKCPYPNIYVSVKRDSSHLEWKLKNWIYQQSNLAIVTPSSWLYKLAQSSMLNQLPIHYVPYGIDTNIYKPLDRQHCRSILEIPKDKKVLLFAAQSINDKRKGSDIVFQALHKLPTSLRSDTILLTFGTGEESIESQVGIPVLHLGFISSEILKPIAFSASDLFLFPTRADNLPLVLQESMSCGVPMVSCDVGGVSDLVRHGVTGYLAKSNNIEDFINGIATILSDDQLRENMSINCRKIAILEYSMELQAQKYIDIYDALIN